jgi:hypothetical protein
VPGVPRSAHREVDPDAAIPNGGSISGMPLLGLDILSGYPGGLGDLLLIVDAA